MSQITHRLTPEEQRAEDAATRARYIAAGIIRPGGRWIDKPTLRICREVQPRPDDMAALREALEDYKAGRYITLTPGELDRMCETGELPDRL